MLSRSNVEANLEFQNLLDHSSELYTKKITKQAVARITDRLKEMAKHENWSQNAIQLILPYLNLMAYKPDTDSQFDIYPITSNGKLSFIVGVKATNYNEMSKLIPHLIDSPFTHIIRSNLADKFFLEVYSESVQQLSKIICKSTSTKSKVTEGDSTVQFLIAPVLYGRASVDDSLLHALKKFAPERKIGKLTSFVPEFEKNIDNVPPKQLAKIARFVYRAEPELFSQILGSLFAKNDIIRLEYEVTIELMALINELPMFDQIYLQDMIQFIYKTSKRIFKHEGGFPIFESYVQNALGCVLKDMDWVNKALVGRNLQVYLRLIFCCFANGDKDMLAAYKKHALFYAEEKEDEFQKMFTDMVKRYFADVFYFENPQKTWSEATKMLPQLKGLEKNLNCYAIEHRFDSTIADVITNNILSDMYITNKERSYYRRTHAFVIKPI